MEEIAKREEVCINVANQNMESEVIEMCRERSIDLTQIKFYHHPTNDAWCRDHGPCFLKNDEGNKLMIDWEFNAWGGKYPPFNLDNAIPSRVAAALGLDVLRPGVVLECGAVDFNGLDTVLTTSSCLINTNRNPGMTKGKMEVCLKQYFGVKQVLWLPQGICGDDTDGHIDTITRFINPHTVVTMMEEDPLEDNHYYLKENYDALKQMKLYGGRPLRVVTLPLPKPRFNGEQRLPCSYANFYICNGAVLVPTFEDPNDEVAMAVLGEYFPDREIVGIDSTEIIRGLGSFHCLCIQEPY